MTKLRGSGPIECCGNHRKRCLFGYPHIWDVWYRDGQLVRTANTLKCYSCGGYCTADEETAMMATMIQRVQQFTRDGVTWSEPYESPVSDVAKHRHYLTKRRHNVVAIDGGIEFDTYPPGYWPPECADIQALRTRVVFVDGEGA